MISEGSKKKIKQTSGVNFCHTQQSSSPSGKMISWRSSTAHSMREGSSREERTMCSRERTSHWGVCSFISLYFSSAARRSSLSGDINLVMSSRKGRCSVSNAAISILTCSRSREAEQHGWERAHRYSPQRNPQASGTGRRKEQSASQGTELSLFFLSRPPAPKAEKRGRGAGSGGGPFWMRRGGGRGAFPLLPASGWVAHSPPLRRATPSPCRLRWFPQRRRKSPRKNVSRRVLSLSFYSAR